VERGEERKSRGAYFTPPVLARRLCDFAIRRRGDTVLDPACGDGVFLSEAIDRGARATGVDIHAPTLRAARRNVPQARLIAADFFDYCSGDERFDAVVGNPPFIRYQRFGPDLSRRAGLSGLSSAWAAFAVLSARLLNPGGRMALVVPREALFADYGRQTIARLREMFRRVRVEPVDGFHFDALQKVALLTCEGAGGRAPADTSDPWRFREVDEASLRAFRELEAAFVPLSSAARVRLGVVTGDKSFFVLSDEAVRRWSLPSSALVPALDASPASLRVRSVEHRLLASDGSAPVRAYVRHGESMGVHRRYKCRIRDPWHRLRLGPRPDGFLSYLVYDRPRLAANEAGAWCTNSFHSVYAPDPLLLAAAFFNPITLMGVELLGRVYGGGVLKIEPGDAARLRVPRRRPDRATARRIDEALSDGDEDEAMAHSMRWLARRGLTASRLGSVLRGYRRLRENRLAG
jgi:predicted RNA methylase